MHISCHFGWERTCAHVSQSIRRAFIEAAGTQSHRAAHHMFITGIGAAREWVSMPPQDQPYICTTQPHGFGAGSFERCVHTCVLPSPGHLCIDAQADGQSVQATASPTLLCRPTHFWCHHPAGNPVDCCKMTDGVSMREMLLRAPTALHFLGAATTPLPMTLLA